MQSNGWSVAFFRFGRRRERFYPLVVVACANAGVYQRWDSCMLYVGPCHYIGDPDLSHLPPNRPLFLEDLRPPVPRSRMSFARTLKVWVVPLTLLAPEPCLAPTPCVPPRAQFTGSTDGRSMLLVSRAFEKMLIVLRCVRVIVSTQAGDCASRCHVRGDLARTDPVFE